jgi:hypothetical protein
MLGAIIGKKLKKTFYISNIETPPPEFCGIMSVNFISEGKIMFCNQCGNQLPEGAAFCTVCGANQNVFQTTSSQSETHNAAINQQTGAESPKDSSAKPYFAFRRKVWSLPC